MTDGTGWYVNFLAERTAKAKAAKTYLLGLVPILKEAGVHELRMHYDGAGDSGETEDTKLYDADGAEIKHTGLDEKRINDNMYDVLEALHGGWEINEGSYGDVVLLVQEARVVVRHNQNVEDVIFSEDEA